MQNYGKFDPTSFGKIEQNWANVAFADALLQIYYAGKSVFSSSVIYHKMYQNHYRSWLLQPYYFSKWRRILRVAFSSELR